MSPSKEHSNLLDFDRPSLAALLAAWEYSTFHADQLWDYLYRQRVTCIAAMSGLRPDLRERLQAETTLHWPESVFSQQSADGTRKFLLRLHDGELVEAVLMPYRDRYTACISTQVGCAMGCVFCATGQMGFTRHLSAAEIVGQILFLRQAAGEEARDLRNIVFMGMGEPLHNYDATMRAVDILVDDKGLSFGPRHLTLSTVGLPGAIRRLADEGRPLNLAVSLHGATDAQRQALIPIANRWPLADLLNACRYYVSKRGRRIFFEWTLIAGQNDTAGQAHALGALLEGLDAHVNLIPLNRTGTYGGTPSQREAIRQFQAILNDYGLPSTVRQRRGIDIAAGCGQLRRRAGLDQS